ncbi:MAG: hypothetical protein M1812_003580 [Candelaria pacifica]|nr:MAG: hypothetical protein M1812_003580 [Candelaria pacifica]
MSTRMFTTSLGSAIAEFVDNAIANALSDMQGRERERPHMHEYDDQRDEHFDRQQWRQRPDSPLFTRHHRHHHESNRDDFDHHHHNGFPPPPTPCTCPRIPNSRPRRPHRTGPNLPFRPRTRPTQPTTNRSPIWNGSNHQYPSSRNLTSPTTTTQCTCAQHGPPVPPKIPLSDSEDSESPIPTPSESPTVQSSHSPIEPNSDLILPIPTPHGILLWSTNDSPQSPQRSQRPKTSHRSHQPHQHKLHNHHHHQPHHNPHLIRNTHHPRSPRPNPRNPPQTSNPPLHDSNSDITPSEYLEIEQMERFDKLVTNATFQDLERRKRIIQEKKRMRGLSDWKSKYGVDENGENDERGDFEWFMSGGQK